MKICSVCNAVMDDDTIFCTSCGTRLAETAPHQESTASVFNATEPVNYTPVYEQAPVSEPANDSANAPVYTAPEYVPPVAPPGASPTAPAQTVYAAPPVVPPVLDPSDHTAEFTPEDVSAHKVYALLVYIGGIIGIIPALLIGKDSPYLKFHVQQKMKLMVSSMLVSMVCAITSFLIIPAIAGGVIAVIIFVLNLICFFKTASGKSVEAPIIKDIKLFK